VKTLGSVCSTNRDPDQCNGTYEYEARDVDLPHVFTVYGPRSSVGIATRYGLDGAGIESRWGVEIFRTRPERPWGPPSLLYNGYRVFPAIKTAGAWR
jgi:hypothetical protein